MWLRRSVSVFVAVLAGTASVAAASGSAAWSARAVTGPARAFAPYFQAYKGDDPATLSQQSGAKRLTMAFVQTQQTGSCTALWNGDPGMPIAQATFGQSIARIRAAGGDVIPSFGGFTADHEATEIADSCTDVSRIAGQFEKIITTYGVSRLDLDIEDESLNNPAGIDRRNKAIKMTEDWAARNARTVRFTYTLPSATTGLVDSGLAVLRNAIRNHARIDLVNIMTFDYFDNAQHEMAADSRTAAAGLHDELAQLFPGKSDAQLWAMIGVTEMIGIDDFGPAETFTLADANAVTNWAVSSGISQLSFWALQRDNGGCPNTTGSDDCSGVQQGTWDFSRAFESFAS